MRLIPIISQMLIRLLHSLEMFDGLGITRIAVGVILHSQPSIRFADFLLGCGGRYT
jgi:hypothetical protein